MLIFDAHLDLAWNALDWNRDLRLPVPEIRAREAGMVGKGFGQGTVSFAELRRGRVGIFIATLLARLMRPGGLSAVNRYNSMEAAYAAVHGQLAYYKILEQRGLLRFIKDWPTLDAHIKTWLRNENTTGPLGFILSMEGADPVLSPEQVQEWWDVGLRIIGPPLRRRARTRTAPAAELFPPGKPFLKEMERVGMILTSRISPTSASTRRWTSTAAPCWRATTTAGRWCRTSGSFRTIRSSGWCRAAP